MSELVDLVESELRERAHELVGEEHPAAPFGVYAISPREAASELARHVERSVFAEFFGNSPELLDAEYVPYEASTTFLCAVDHRRWLPAGMMRLVLPSPRGLKTVADAAQVWGVSLARAAGGPVDESDACDVATIAVAPGYRRPATQGLVSLALYQALSLGLRRFGTRYVVATLDVVVLDVLHQVLGDFFEVAPGARPVRFLDSPASVPVWCDLHAYYERLALADPSLYDVVVHGRGLEGAVSPPVLDRDAWPTPLPATDALARPAPAGGTPTG